MVPRPRRKPVRDAASLSTNAATKDASSGFWYEFPTRRSNPEVTSTTRNGGKHGPRDDGRDGREVAAGRPSLFTGKTGTGSESARDRGKRAGAGGRNDRGGGSSVSIEKTKRLDIYRYNHLS